MPIVATRDEIDAVLLPALRGGRHGVLVADSPAGHAELTCHALALAAAGVGSDDMIVGRIAVVDPAGRTWELAVLAVAKAAVPGFAAGAAGLRGIPAGPKQDVVVVSDDPARVAGVVLALLGGGVRHVELGAN